MDHFQVEEGHEEQDESNNLSSFPIEAVNEENGEVSENEVVNKRREKFQEKWEF